MSDDKLQNIKAKLHRENKVINYFIWDVEIQGRIGTSWENGVYKGTLNFKKEYPNARPEFFFLKPKVNGKDVLFRHMNVS